MKAKKVFVMAGLVFILTAVFAAFTVPVTVGERQGAMEPGAPGRHVIAWKVASCSPI